MNLTHFTICYGELKQKMFSRQKYENIPHETYLQDSTDSYTAFRMDHPSDAKISFWRETQFKIYLMHLIPVYIDVFDKLDLIYLIYLVFCALYI